MMHETVRLKVVKRWGCWHVKIIIGVQGFYGDCLTGTKGEALQMRKMLRAALIAAGAKVRYE